MWGCEETKGGDMEEDFEEEEKGDAGDDADIVMDGGDDKKFGLEEIGDGAEGER